MGVPLTVATVIAGMTLAAMPAGDPGWTPQTQLDCQPYPEMLVHLRATYSQTPISGGALHDSADPDAGGLVIVASPRGESWSLVVLTSDGKNACVGAWGRNWQQSFAGRRLPTNLPPDGKPRMD